MDKVESDYSDYVKMFFNAPKDSLGKPAITNSKAPLAILSNSTPPRAEPALRSTYLSMQSVHYGV